MTVPMPLSVEHKVLDHGFIRLVDHMGSDFSIAQAARVSYERQAGKDEASDAKLIAYLWRNQHTSPFEACVFKFDIKAPVFVFRQWHRHRTWSFNEVSGRYTKLPNEFYLPSPDKIGVQSKSNRQARDITSPRTQRDNSDLFFLKNHMEASFKEYESLIEAGWPRELARIVLPLATYSHMFATVDLLNLFKFIKLRIKPDAQYEIRVYAEVLLSIVQGIVPAAAKAFMETI